MQWLKVSARAKPLSNQQGGESAVQLKCSMCGQPFNRGESAYVPFCSQRCQQADLGNWLNERYSLPYEGDDDPQAADIPADDF